MTDFEIKSALKQFLLENKDITGSWEFEKTKFFCDQNNISFKNIMLELLEWQKEFDKTHVYRLTDDDLLYTIL